MLVAELHVRGLSIYCEPTRSLSSVINPPLQARRYTVNTFEMSWILSEDTKIHRNSICCLEVPSGRGADKNK